MKAIVGWILIISAFGFYAYGMGLAIKFYICIDIAATSTTKFPAELAGMLNTMQAIFLANLGVLLGISLAKPESSLAKRLLFIGRKDMSEKTKDPLDLQQQIQYTAIILFLLSLFACLISWVSKGFLDGSKYGISIINDSVKMLFGTILTYVSIVLGIKPEPKQ